MCHDFFEFFGIMGKPTPESAVILGPPGFSGFRRRFGTKKNFKKFQKNT
jgi:hypothetical protein